MTLHSGGRVVNIPPASRSLQGSKRSSPHREIGRRDTEREEERDEEEAEKRCLEWNRVLYVCPDESSAIVRCGPSRDGAPQTPVRSLCLLSTAFPLSPSVPDSSSPSLSESLSHSLSPSEASQ